MSAAEQARKWDAARLMQLEAQRDTIAAVAYDTGKRGALDAFDAVHGPELARLRAVVDGQPAGEQQAERVDVLTILADAGTWAQQVADRGGIPQGVRGAAAGIAYQQGRVRAAIAELIEAATAEHKRAGRPIFGEGMHSYDRLAAALRKVQP
jgi:hypothetical protein